MEVPSERMLKQTGPTTAQARSYLSSRQAGDSDGD